MRKILRIFGCLLIVFLALFYSGGPAVGESMMPTIKNACKTITIKHLIPKRYDIIDFHGIDDKTKGHILCKRIIGMPGDHIEYKYSEEDGCYRYFINGEKELKSYETYDEYIDAIYNYPYGDIYLSEDEYFVAGDNRADSYDSRFFGPVNKEYIIGKKIFWF